MILSSKRKLCLNFQLCFSLFFILELKFSRGNSNIYNCNPISCPYNQGMCLGNICKCSLGFTTYHVYCNNSPQTTPSNYSKSETYCNYRQLCAYTAFFLEFMFPFGAGHLYARNFKQAILKFFSFSIFFCFICGEFFLFKFKLSILSKLDRIIVFIIISDIFIWFIFHLADIICYGAGIYSDGNGIELLR
jgi:hypothetical protein